MITMDVTMHLWFCGWKPQNDIFFSAKKWEGAESSFCCREKNQQCMKYRNTGYGTGFVARSVDLFENIKMKEIV